MGLFWLDFFPLAFIFFFSLVWFSMASSANESLFELFSKSYVVWIDTKPTTNEFIYGETLLIIIILDNKQKIE